MRHPIHQYNQSGDLQLSQTGRAVYENGPEKASEPQQAQQAPKPPEAKSNAPSILDTFKASAQSIAKLFIKPWGAIKNNTIFDETKNSANTLSVQAANLVEKANTVPNDIANAAKLQEMPIVQKLVESAPTVTPPAAPAEDTSLNLKEVVITEADVASGQILKKTEALFDTTLKGKVTPKGWLNYLGDTNGISQDIAGNSGTFSKNDLETKNFIVSSPVSTVEAIKLLQQSLGVTADGIFGPATYDALIKKNSGAALILREEKPVDTSLDLKEVVITQ